MTGKSGCPPEPIVVKYNKQKTQEDHKAITGGICLFSVCEAFKSIVQTERSLQNRAVDPHKFLADPDPALFLNADPDPGGKMNADPDPT